MAKFDYLSAVPKKSFIHNYMLSMQDLETATAFDFWSSLWLMSIALGRDIIVDRPRLPVHLNVYTIFVGESGWPRKSTAVRHALTVAREYIDIFDPETIIVTDATTPPKLVSELVGQSASIHRATCAIAISELVRFLGRDIGAGDMPGLLTDLYDCPELSESPGTIARGHTVIRNAYVSFLAASTPAWLHRSINTDVISGGFTSRILFVRAEEGKKKIAWPNDSGSFDKKQFVTMLRRMYEATMVSNNGRIELDEAAMESYSSWYRARNLHRDEFRASFESREDEHILRVAALLSINSFRSVVSESDVRSAISLITQIKDDASDIFDSGLSYNRTMLGVESVARILQDAGPTGIKQGDLARKVRHRFDGKDLRATLSVLKHLRCVRELIGQPEGGGRPHTRWSATELLASVDIREVINKIPEYHTEIRG